ncbi:MAG: glycoside hydrolase family 172 protein [Eubacteriales bacterium]
MLHNLTHKHDSETFSVSPENPTGEKGRGGMAVTGSASGAARELGQGWKVNPFIVVQPGETAVLADIRGQGAVKHFWITDSASAGRQLILRIYFDGHENPAVEVPLSDFFANADYREYRQLSSLPICFNPKRGMNCYFEMPYFTAFRFTIENRGTGACNIYYQIDCEKKRLDADSLYFHAQFRRVNPLPYMQPYVILDNIRGNGHYVGTYLNWGVKSNGWWGEGEIKFYIDGDTDFPTVCGTGTEDYFCGAYNFDVDGRYTEFCTPYTGMYKVGFTDGTYRSQRYFNLYRWHITDPVYFKKDLRVTIQALGWRSEGRYLPLQDDISSVAYWYSDTLDDVYPPLPSVNEAEII